MEQTQKLVMIAGCQTGLLSFTGTGKKLVRRICKEVLEQECKLPVGEVDFQEPLKDFFAPLELTDEKAVLTRSMTWLRGAKFQWQVPNQDLAGYPQCSILSGMALPKIRGVLETEKKICLVRKVQFPDEAAMVRKLGGIVLEVVCSTDKEKKDKEEMVTKKRKRTVKRGKKKAPVVIKKRGGNVPAADFRITYEGPQDEKALRKLIHQFFTDHELVKEDFGTLTSDKVVLVSLKQNAPVSKRKKQKRNDDEVGLAASSVHPAEIAVQS